MLVLLCGFVGGGGCEPDGPPGPAVSTRTPVEEKGQSSGSDPSERPLVEPSDGPAVSPVGKDQQFTIQELRRDGWTVETNGFEEAVRVSREDQRLGVQGGRRLAKLETLETIHLWNCADADDQLVAVLAGLPRLRVLVLRGAAVSDKSWEDLVRSQSLESLNLGDNPAITGRGLAPLIAAGRLKRLYLDGTKISDAALLEISVKSSLEVLILNRTPITDAAIPSLKRMTSLKSLFVVGTGLSPAGREKLGTALPGCVIVPAPTTLPTPAPR